MILVQIFVKCQKTRLKCHFLKLKELSTVLLHSRVEKKRSLCHTTLIPAGFEPATVRLEGECSIQLSYETTTLLFYQKVRHSSNPTCGKGYPAGS